MYVVCVRVHVLLERVEDFLASTLENAKATRGEPGNTRFDVLRAHDDPARFFLYEVYCGEEDFKAHQRSPHYLKWKERVAPWMATPRIGEKHTSVFPDPWT